MTLEDELTVTIADHTAGATVPAPDLAGVRRRGRVRRRRRTAGALVAVAAASAGAVMMGQAVGGGVSLHLRPEPQHFEPVKGLNYSHGLRAFASPDENGELSLGGRRFSREDMGYLDTDATATPYGVVFFDRAQQAHLLREDGRDVTLAPAPTGPAGDFRPSSKADAQLPVVAFTQPGDDGVQVLLHDLRAGRTVGTYTVPCSGSGCGDVVVDGVDSGLVFVRTGDGTYVWDHDAAGDARWTLLGEGRFRVADVRNGRIMWTGAPPSPVADSPVADWPLTKGAIDAQLSFDGGHVLYWSPRLKPTTPGGSTIRLDVKDAIWFTFDTDGSVLAAANGKGQQSIFYDCEIPSGTCTEIGTVTTRSGDPMFIGDDM